MPSRAHRDPMREALVSLCILLAPLVAAATTTDEASAPTGALTLWSTSAPGAHAGSFEVLVPAGARCDVTLLARGRDAEAGPYLALVVEGNRNVAVRQAGTSIPGDAEVITHVDDLEIRAGDGEELENWAENVTLGGSSDGRLHVAFAVRDADRDAPMSGIPTPDRPLLAGLAARVDVRCDWLVHGAAMRDVQGFLLFTERGLASGVGVDVRFPSVHAGAREGLSFFAAGDVFSAGDLGGDPARLTRVTLERPSGTDTWAGLPTAYVGGPGDLGWRLTDGPGRYALAIDTASALVQVRGAFFILG